VFVKYRPSQIVIDAAVPTKKSCTAAGARAAE